MKVPNCLICYRKDRLDIRHGFRLSKDQENVKLSNEIRVIFIFRELLRVPETMCHKFLRKYGNPSCWISTCSRCALLIDEALFIHAQINQLQRTLQEFSLEIRKEVKQTNFECSKGSIYSKNDLLKVTHETRNFVAVQGDETLPTNNEIPITNTLGEVENNKVEDIFQLIAESEIEPFDDFIKEEVDYIVEDDSDANNGNDITDNLDFSDGDHGIDNDNDSNDKELVMEADDQINGTVEESESLPLNNSSVVEATSKRKLASRNLDAASNKQKRSLLYTCDICDNGYDNPNSLRNHRRKIHNIYGIEDKKAGWQPNPIVISLQQDETCQSESRNPEQKTKKNVTFEGITDGQQKADNEIISQQQEPIGMSRKKGPRDSNNCHCGQNFNSYQALVDHKKESHFTQDIRVKPPKLDHCEFCGRKFGKYSSLRTHRLRVHNARLKPYIPKPKVVDPKPWKCNVNECGEGFLLDSERDEHERTVHGKQTNENPLFTCIKCIKGYSTKNDLKLHYEVTHKRAKVGTEGTEIDEDMLTCDKCPKFKRKYATEEELRRHILRIHEGDKLPYKCKICGKGCHSPSYLRLHLQKHSGERLFMCDQCSKTFRQNTHLNFHKVREHGNGVDDESNPLRCDECGKMFSTTQYVRLHKKTIHEKSFKHICHICGMGTQNASNLKAHLKTHNEDHIKSLKKPGRKNGVNWKKKRKSTVNKCRILRKRKSKTTVVDESSESEIVEFKSDERDEVIHKVETSSASDPDSSHILPAGIEQSLSFDSNEVVL